MWEEKKYEGILLCSLARKKKLCVDKRLLITSQQHKYHPYKPYSKKAVERLASSNLAWVINLQSACCAGAGARSLLMYWYNNDNNDDDALVSAAANVTSPLSGSQKSR